MGLVNADDDGGGVVSVVQVAEEINQLELRVGDDHSEYIKLQHR